MDAVISGGGAVEIFEHFHEDNAADATPGKKYVPGAVAAAERKLAGQVASASKESRRPPIRPLLDDGSNAAVWVASMKPALKSVPVPLMPTSNLGQVFTGEVDFRKFHDDQPLPRSSLRLVRGV